MRQSMLGGLAAISLAAFPALALAADQVPDVKGQWAGETYTIVAGKGGHWPTSTGTFEKPGLFEKHVVLAITGQDGRRFWGVTTISGSGETTDEPFIGELHGADNRSVLIADTDGYFTGTIDGDTFSFCYANAGGKTNSSVVSCTDVKRTP